MGVRFFRFDAGRDDQPDHPKRWSLKGHGLKSEGRHTDGKRYDAPAVVALLLEAAIGRSASPVETGTPQPLGSESSGRRRETHNTSSRPGPWRSCRSASMSISSTA